MRLCKEFSSIVVSPTDACINLVLTIARSMSESYDHLGPPFSIVSYIMGDICASNSSKHLKIRRQFRLGLAYYMECL